MCHWSCIAFGQKHLLAPYIADKAVLEVGSLNVNGSLRAHVLEYDPKWYVGVDMRLGPCVDEVVDACALVERFGPNSFDVVYSTEMLEHVKDWRGALHNMKVVLREGGLILVTTRSPGFPLHEHPHDYWRFTDADMRRAFADFILVGVESDPQVPGIFIAAVKPSRWKEADLSGMSVIAMGG